jgi:hypothetical protein
VSHQGQRDVNLFFDKRSGLLVKSQYTVKPEERGGKEVSQEVVYGNYKEVQGLQQPMKIAIKRDGKQLVEAHNSDMKLSESLPDADFAKPLAALRGRHTHHPGAACQRWPRGAIFSPSPANLPAAALTSLMQGNQRQRS